MKGYNISQISVRKAESLSGIRDLFLGLRYYTIVREAEKESERGSWRIREKSLTGP